MVVGSGPTGYDGSSTQHGKLFAVELKRGPVDASGENIVVAFPTSEPMSFMGDISAVDANLDFRVDAVYVGSAVHHGQEPAWTGTLYRLVVRGDPDARTWGITDGADQIPSVLLRTLPPRIMPQIDLLASEPLDPTEVPVTYGFVGEDLQALAFQILEERIGPITAAPTVSVDEQGEVWVFVGTGRFYGTLDKTNSDAQHLFGLKDPVLTGQCLEYNVTSCARHHLMNVSDASICWRCPPGAQHLTGVGGASTFENLVSHMRTGEGWYVELTSPRERAVSSPSLVGGMLVFPTFIPTNSLCSTTGHSYALYYETGTAYKAPLLASTFDPSGQSAEGLDPQGNVLRKVSLGQAGMVSRPVIHLGQEPPRPTRRLRIERCQTRSLGFIQSSFGPLTEICAKPALSTGSRYLSWMNMRQ
jgi:type IV pilus assembly protein PilY1